MERASSPACGIIRTMTLCSGAWSRTRTLMVRRQCYIGLSLLSKLLTLANVTTNGEVTSSRAVIRNVYHVRSVCPLAAMRGLSGDDPPVGSNFHQKDMEVGGPGLGVTLPHHQSDFDLDGTWSDSTRCCIRCANRNCGARDPRLEPSQSGSDVILAECPQPVILFCPIGLCASSPS